VGAIYGADAIPAAGYAGANGSPFVPLGTSAAQQAIAARIQQLSEQGASIEGKVTVGADLVAEVELMFSHIDQNMAGLKFPEHNFVFTEQFTELLKTYRQGAAVTL